ncbi:MAG: AAA family ATPase, partial [Gammaproteobacteria bacterium]|nr:AAA family ATPase [Gammaproteobacteria bacterium]
CKVNTIDIRNYLKNEDKNKKSHGHDLKITINQAESVSTNEKREKQDIRQAFSVKAYVENYLNQHEKTLVFSQSKTAAEKLNLLIRGSLIEHGKISHEQHRIIAITPVFLSRQEQKHAKFYPKDAFIKIYKGRGQYDVKKITRYDLNSNKIIVSNEKNRFESVSPKDLSSLIQKNEASIFYEKDMEISKGDLLCLSQSNKQSTLLNLKIGETYKILEINDKKTLLEIKSNPEKTLSIKTKRLNGLAITYDYVHSIHEKLPVSLKKTILCDLPHHALNANVLSELTKHGNHIHIITDNKIKAEKKLHIDQSKQNAVDQKLQDITPEKTPTRTALDYAIAVVGSREAAFRQEDLIKKGMSYKIASVSLADVHSEVRNILSEGILHMREDKFGEVIFATSEAIKLEKEIIVQIKNGKNQVPELISSLSAKSFLKNTNLSQGQKEACELISTTKDRFVMIQGYAGTGKSTMLQTLIGDRTLDTLQTMLPKEVSVLALAPTHQAVIELQKKHIEAKTLKSFLIDTKSDQSNINLDLKNKLIIVDESSMISNSDFHQLQAVIEKNNARCAYLGDIAQLSAVEAGKPSELAYISKEADIATAVMLENKRQIDPELKKIANLLMAGGLKNFSSAFDLLEKNGLIIEINPEKTIKSKNDGDQLSSTQMLAQTYATLPEGERIQTLVAAATNHDRIKINEEIRRCLKKQGELSQNSISMQILDDSRLTDAELRVAEHYKSGMIVKYQNEYKNVVNSDVKSNFVTLSDKKGEISILSLPHLAKNNFIELYDVRNIEINPGEHVKFTKTDRDRNIRANLSLTVESIDLKNKTITAKTAQDEKHIIYFNENNDQHVDYSYCSTTHGLQAATSKSVFILSNSYNKLSNTMRQIYVALTRAQEKALIFTDDKEKIKRQIIWNEGEKASALEAMGLLEKRQSIAHKKTPLEKTTVNNKTISLDAKLVEKNLALQVKEIARNILGEPNHSLSNDINWRYGSKGSLSVVVDGDKAGYFHNFETGEKGGMITLLMSELRLPFKEALEHASNLLGGANLTKQSAPAQEKLPPIKTIVGSEKKQEYINKLISQSKPLVGTIAEKYLQGRAIKDMKNTTLRFLEHVTTGGGNKDKVPFSSALMAISHNEDGKPQAIQLTYLDKDTGAKVLGLPIAKRTLNSPSGAFVNLTPQIKSPQITFVAEGVETALSIRDTAMQIKNAQVVATLGKSNIENIPLQKTASTIVLVLDNDLKNPLHDSVIKNAMKHFEENGKRVVCIFPEAINNKKTDYNDLAQAGQSNKIAQDINRAFEQYKNATQLSDANVQSQKPKERYRDMEREFLG